jgi:hypothetical protein
MFYYHCLARLCFSRTFSSNESATVSLESSPLKYADKSYNMPMTMERGHRNVWPPKPLLQLVVYKKVCLVKVILPLDKECSLGKYCKSSAGKW